MCTPPKSDENQNVVKTFADTQRGRSIYPHLGSWKGLHKGKNMVKTPTPFFLSWVNHGFIFTCCTYQFKNQDWMARWTPLKILLPPFVCSLVLCMPIAAISIGQEVEALNESKVEALLRQDSMKTMFYRIYSYHAPYGVFPKMVVPNNHWFSYWKWSFWGVLGVPPFKETPILQYYFASHLLKTMHGIWITTIAGPPKKITWNRKMMMRSLMFKFHLRQGCTSTSCCFPHLLPFNKNRSLWFAVCPCLVFAMVLNITFLTRTSKHGFFTALGEFHGKPCISLKTST